MKKVSAARPLLREMAHEGADEGVKQRRKRQSKDDDAAKDDDSKASSDKGQKHEEEPQAADGNLGLTRPLIWLFALWIVMLYFRDSTGGDGSRQKQQETAVVENNPPPSASDLGIKPEASPPTLSAVGIGEAMTSSDNNREAKVVIQPTRSSSTSSQSSKTDEELKKFLEARYPRLIGSIEGRNYPPPDYAVWITQIVGYCQIGTLAMMLAGNKILAMVGIAEPPQWLVDAQENKIAVFAAVFLANTLANSLTATGAFEITLDDQIVYSKLETGRMPTGDEIIRRMTELGIMQ